MLLWDDSLVDVSSITFTPYCLSAMVGLRGTDVFFKITTVYGPTDPASKDTFFAELLSQKLPTGTAWLATGDFNQIYRARDKNKRSVNRGRINRFRATLQNCELKEIHLQNRRRFTWSNKRINPTLCKLDSSCKAGWDAFFNTRLLNTLSSSLSDHCPFLLADGRGPRRPRFLSSITFGRPSPVSTTWFLGREMKGLTTPSHTKFYFTSSELRLSEWSRGLFS